MWREGTVKKEVRGVRDLPFACEVGGGSHDLGLERAFGLERWEGCSIRDKGPNLCKTPGLSRSWGQEESMASGP
jgi:hypothetical protein